MNLTFDDVVSLPVREEIHPGDVMWNTGPSWYFSVGQSALMAISRVLAQHDPANVKRILDLPCGHGRVGRYLRAGFPDAEIVFCDIEKDGVDFCAKTFSGM